MSTHPESNRHADRLTRNLRLIPVLAALSSSLVYLPVFVLFTRARFGIEGALQIGALTYLFVVLLEVPSGWMSDRVGRVPTLVVAAASAIVGHTCFLIGDDRFVVIVIGQFFVSAGYAFISGTDVSLHFDTLESLDRSHEYASRQAKVASIGYLSTAVSAVCGGLLGLIDLRLAFVAALALAVFQLLVASRLVEPWTATTSAAFVHQVRDCLGYLRSRFMGWLFFYGIALVTLEHVATTLAQPWLTEVLNKEPDELGATPLLSGLLFAIIAFVGSMAASQSAGLGRRFGTVAALIMLAVVSAIIVSGMALTFSVAAVALVAMRSIQGAAAPVLLSAAIAPRTEPQHRATLLSLNSLAGRLGYGSILLVLSDGALDDPQPVLRVLAVTSWILIGVLVLTAIVVLPRGSGRVSG